MLPMLLAAAAALLPGTTVAQRVCMDDDDFVGGNRFLTPVGYMGSCGDWMFKHFVEPSDNYSCHLPLNISLPNISGTTLMPAFELQAHMAGMGGCCKSKMSACMSVASFVKPQYGSCPPHAPILKDGGYCSPCYNRLKWKDGEMKCVDCWELGADGCENQQECESVRGMWNGSCHVCTVHNVDGCRSEYECTKHGANWFDRDGGRCKKCQMWDSAGCTEEQCNEMNMTWFCEDHGECKCGRCSVDGVGGHWAYCNKDQCNKTASAPDVQWVEWWGEGRMRGRCARCNRSHMGDLWDTGACDSREKCSYVGFVWSESNCEGSSCCQPCMPEANWGCQDNSSCIETGGEWCGEGKTGMCKDKCDPPPDPLACKTITPAQALLIAKAGLRPKSCK